ADRRGCCPRLTRQRAAVPAGEPDLVCWPAMSTPPSAGRPLLLDPASLQRLTWAFGITQIVSWGSLFYAIGVLGKSIRADLGISEPMLFGAVSAALLINGLGRSE